MGRSPAQDMRQYEESVDDEGFVVKRCSSSRCSEVRGMWRWPMDGSITCTLCG